MSAVIIRILILLLLLFWAHAGEAAAQGGSGEPIKKPGRDSKPPAKKITQRKPSPLGPKPKISYSSLIVEGDIARAEISLFQNGKRVFSYTEPSGSANVKVIDRLRWGTYQLVVRRKKFLEFSRTVMVESKAERTLVTLQPMFGYISIICTNVPDAMIEIEGVGQLTGSVDRLQIEPGKYRVSVGRSGYVTQAFTVEIRGFGLESRTITTLTKR